MEIIKVSDELIALAKESGYPDGIRTVLAYTSIIMLNQPKIVVEIGSFHGFSACCFGTGIADNPTKRQGSMVYTIDVSPKMTEITKANIQKFELENYVMALTGDGKTIIKENPLLHQIGFLFIDGNHSHNEAYKDIMETFRYVNKGGWILCHDYASEDTRRGIDKAFRELEEKGFLIDKIYFNVFAGGLLARKL